MRQRLLWSRRRFAKANQQRRKRINKTFNAARGIYEFAGNEETVLKEIWFRLQSAGARVWRVRERIPATKCKSCGSQVFVGESSDAGHPDLHGYFPTRIWNLHRAPSSMPEMFCRLVERPANRPVHFFIEVKREKGGRVSFQQEQFIRERNAEGGIAFVANSWEAVRYEFGERGISLPPAHDLRNVLRAA